MRELTEIRGDDAKAVVKLDYQNSNEKKMSRFVSGSGGRENDDIVGYLVSVMKIFHKI